jgi:hypothetical protein
LTIVTNTFVSGGVFKSTDSGGTWIAANTGLTNLGVRALAIDPATAATLCAGTYGGIFKSTDSGATGVPVNVGLPSSGVLALALDPTRGSSLYAGLAPGGVWQLRESTYFYTVTPCPYSIAAMPCSGGQPLLPEGRAQPCRSRVAAVSLRPLKPSQLTSR